MSTSEVYGIVLIPIILAILASLPGLLALRKSRNQKVAENADTIGKLQKQLEEQAQAWLRQYQLNQELQDKYDVLQGEVECWRDIFEKWKNGISKLVNQVVRLGEEPEWQPGEDDLDCLKQTIAKGIKK